MFLARLRQLETRGDELSRGTLANAVISEGGITIRDAPPRDALRRT